MSARLLLDNFDLIATSPGGIAKLKETILTLAMQGRLVPQDESDEPAAILLERIKSEKQQLIAQGKLKKEKPLPLITAEEQPYDLPTGWEWVRLGEIANIKSSKRIYEHDYISRGIPFFRSKEIGELSRGEDNETEIYISEEKYEHIRKNFGVPQKGDLFLTSVGSIGNTWISDGRRFYYKDGNITQITKHDNIDNQYIQKFIQSAEFQKQIFETVSGTAYNALTIIKINNLVIPLPPLAEQHRIVAKIEELFAACDDLATEYNRQQNRRQAYSISALHHLADAQAETFAQYRDQVLAGLATILATPADVKQLRQTILTLAMQGRLVPQEESDEPAAILLERIKSEKQQLIAQGKLKKEKPLPPITAEEQPYELPTGWEWVRLGEIGDWGAGATPSRDNVDYYDGDIPWLKTGELTDSYIEDSEETISDLALQECSLRLNSPGDVLIAMYGATIGKLGLLRIHATTNQACCACTPFPGVFNWYLFYYLLKEREGFRSLGAGGAQPNISKQKLTAHTFPIPPLVEQHRIVAKIEELFAVCDELEVALARSADRQAGLTASILHAVSSQ